MNKKIRDVFSIFGVIILGSLFIFCMVHPDKIIPNQEPMHNNYSFYRTQNPKEYVLFLKKLDNSPDLELISLSTQVQNFIKTGPTNQYIVTYKITDNPKKNTTKYDYFFYETTNKEDYQSFLNTLSKTHEIIDVSYTKIKKESKSYFYYSITYRKQL